MEQRPSVREGRPEYNEEYHLGHKIIIEDRGGRIGWVAHAIDLSTGKTIAYGAPHYMYKDALFEMIEKLRPIQPGIT